MGVLGRATRSVRSRSVAVALLAFTITALLVGGCGDDEGDATTTAAELEAVPHFAYSGEEGPRRWGDLDESYELCAEGDEQSPIDLSAAKKGSPAPVGFDYGEAEIELENNGHSVEAVVAPGSTVEIDGTGYGLLQFHFHASSEHLVDGTSFPLEFHFVNEADDGGLAVFGVFAERGRENPAFAELTEDLPSEEGDVGRVAETVDVEALLPDDPGNADRWSYPGSLTTPPCSEGVDWFVFTDPIEMSSEQIVAFTDVYADNHRPIQPLNDRTVIVGG